MKRKRRVLYFLLIALVSQSVFFVQAIGKGIKAERIPWTMKPCTVIKFISDDEYVILSGGGPVTKTAAIKKEGFFQAEKILAENFLPNYCETPQKPKKGYIVSYDNKGDLTRIAYPNILSERMSNIHSIMDGIYFDLTNFRLSTNDENFKEPEKGSISTVPKNFSLIGSMAYNIAVGLNCPHKDVYADETWTHEYLTEQEIKDSLK